MESVAIIAAVAAAIVATTAAARTIARAFRATYRFVRLVDKAAHAVLYQLLPNNGASLHDRICRIENHLGLDTDAA
jgi:hypothetical protein